MLKIIQNSSSRTGRLLGLARDPPGVGLHARMAGAVPARPCAPKAAAPTRTRAACPCRHGAEQPGRRAPALGSQAARAARGRSATLPGVAAALLLLPRGGSRLSRRGQVPPRREVPRPGCRCPAAVAGSLGGGPASAPGSPEPGTPCLRSPRARTAEWPRRRSARVPHPRPWGLGTRPRAAMARPGPPHSAVGPRCAGRPRSRPAGAAPPPRPRPGVAPWPMGGLPARAGRGAAPALRRAAGGHGRCVAAGGRARVEPPGGFARPGAERLCLGGAPFRRA